MDFAVERAQESVLTSVHVAMPNIWEQLEWVLK